MPPARVRPNEVVLAHQNLHTRMLIWLSPQTSIHSGLKGIGMMVDRRTLGNAVQPIVCRAEPLVGEPENGLERGHRCAAAVEAENVLVEVRLQMMGLDAPVMRSKQPRLEVRENAMDQRKNLRGASAAGIRGLFLGSRGGSLGLLCVLGARHGCPSVVCRPKNLPSHSVHLADTPDIQVIGYDRRDVHRSRSAADATSSDSACAIEHAPTHWRCP